MPMCAQFENKIFPASDAPKLPLCPSCSCAYEYYFKSDLPSDAIISAKEDFVLPAECTSIFYETQQSIYKEKDIYQKIQICENSTKKLPSLMAPYISAKFSAPAELAYRDSLPYLYMQIGEWEKAEAIIKRCILANAYSPEDGSKELDECKLYQKVAIEALSYISKNPGTLQRNIYKVLEYNGEEKELLIDFLCHSRLIEKIKYNNTNQLYCKEKNHPKKRYKNICQPTNTP